VADTGLFSDAYKTRDTPWEADPRQVQALRAQGLSSEAEDLCGMWVRGDAQA